MVNRMPISFLKFLPVIGIENGQSSTLQPSTFDLQLFLRVADHPFPIALPHARNQVDEGASLRNADNKS
jgi:hypothetical protein